MNDRQIDAQTLIEAYRRRVTAAVGTQVEPHLWDAALSEVAKSEGADE